MIKSITFAAGAALLASAAPAYSAELVFVEVRGTTSGSVWDTDQSWAVFIQQPFGNVLNPTHNFSADPINEGMNNYTIAGEGWASGTEVNSDATYGIRLRFADGAEISGLYTFGLPGGGFAGGTSTVVNGITYTMTGFGWDRSRADNVQAGIAVSGGDPFDYTGQFSFNAIGVVPEPATWALFILGFGAIGATLRRRSGAVRVNKAELNFA